MEGEISAGTGAGSAAADAAGVTAAADDDGVLAESVLISAVAVSMVRLLRALQMILL